MIFAHLDAFLADCMRCGLVQRPDLLARDKQVKWGQVLKCRNWDSLIEHFSEDYVFEFTWKTMTERVAHLRSALNLELTFSEERIARLQRASHVRHILIHNGGRVSKEFITRTGESHLTIGRPIPLLPIYAKELRLLSGQLADDLFVTISKQCFDREVPRSYQIDERQSAVSRTKSRSQHDKPNGSTAAP